MNVVDKLTARHLPARTAPRAAFLVHTTGDTDLDAILRFYDRPDGLQPHDVIDWDGTVYRVAREDVVAYHCKIEDAEARLYQLGLAEWSRWRWDDKQKCPVATDDGATRYAAWTSTWAPRGKRSPLDLATGGHPNFHSHGIELRAPVKAGPRIFTDAQYESLAERVLDVNGRAGTAAGPGPAGERPLALSRETVLGHYDCSPMRRSTSRGGWDPGDAFDWAWLLARLAGPAVCAAPGAPPSGAA